MKSKTKLFSVGFLFLIVFALVAQPALAQTGLVPCKGTVADPCTFKHLVLIVMKAINILLGLSWLFAVFFVFWGGWSIVTAFGNSEGIEKGKKTFGNAVIGFFLIMVAYILLNFTVVAFTGQPFDSLLLYIPYP